MTLWLAKEDFMRVVTDVMDVELERSLQPGHKPQSHLAIEPGLQSPMS